MVGPPRHHIAHFIERQARRGKLSPASLMRQQLRQIGQALLLLAIGTVKFHNADGSIGRGLADFDQFLIARQFTGQKWIGKHFLQPRDRGAAFGLKTVEVELVNTGELQQKLHRQRSLIALDQVQVRRRNTERLGHRRLGQAPLVADAPDAWAGKYLAFAHLVLPTHNGSFTIHDKIAVKFIFDKIYKFTVPSSQNSDSITSIISSFYWFFWRTNNLDCKSGHRKSADKLLFQNQSKV